MLNFKTVVINLDRRPDRLGEFESRFGGGFDRVSAVDGARLVSGGGVGMSEFARGLLSDLGGSGRKVGGVLGCWLSHVGLWDDLLMSDFDGFVVFEDDAFFVEGFEDRLNEILGVVDESMSVVYFGGRAQKNFWPRNVDDGGKWGSFDRGGVTFHYPKYVFYGRDYDRTTHAYIVTRRGAKLLFDEYRSYAFEKKPAVDGFMNMGRARIRSLDVFPHIAWSPVNYKSDIQ